MTIRRLNPGDAFRFSPDEPVLIWKGHGQVFSAERKHYSLDVFKDFPRIDGEAAERVPFSALSQELRSASARATADLNAYRGQCPRCLEWQGDPCRSTYHGTSLRYPHSVRVKR